MRLSRGQAMHIPGPPAWSRRAAHRLAAVDDLNPAIVSIGDTRSLACAAALRATCGFEEGRHEWSVHVELCSDWSYVGFVAEPWAGVESPVGRSAHSWGVASNGAAYAGRKEISRLRAFSTGSRISISVDMGAGSADVVIDGQAFPEVFRDLPRPLFPAVSNCRSAARYTLAWETEDE